jgi:hypothetical protein
MTAPISVSATEGTRPAMSFSPRPRRVPEIEPAARHAARRHRGDAGASDVGQVDGLPLEIARLANRDGARVDLDLESLAEGRGLEGVGAGHAGSS